MLNNRAKDELLSLRESVCPVIAVSSCCHGSLPTTENDGACFRPRRVMTNKMPS